MNSDKPEKSPVLSQTAVGKKKEWNPEAVLEEALKEREKLLKSRPELQELQAEIDRRLDGVEKFEDRMAILGKMIGSRLNRLSDNCDRFESLCHDIGIQTELPLTQFKKSLSKQSLFLTDEDQ